MNFIKKIVSSLRIPIISLLSLAFTHQTALACTGIALKAEDGTFVYGRTMEWGAFDLNSRVAIIPRE